MSTNDPIAAVRQYVGAFNKGDATEMAATFAVPGSILDGMAPHVWQGPTATQDWYRDVLVEGKQHGASDYFITMGEPLHNNVTGDSAYVVVPATMTFKVHGKQVTARRAFTARGPDNRARGFVARAASACCAPTATHRPPGLSECRRRTRQSLAPSAMKAITRSSRLAWPERGSC